MATHSIILAWKIPRVEETDGLQSMGSGSQRVGRDQATEHAQCVKMSLKEMMLVCGSQAPHYSPSEIWQNSSNQEWYSGPWLGILLTIP